jgi:CRISPR/Cas system-associated exonuclease Cas4 (RecB family)
MKNLLNEVMIKTENRVSQMPSFLNTQDLINKIQHGYIAKRETKFTTKKSFAPSTIAYSHGECPRYWYLAFEGAMFEDNADAYGGANMTSGTKSHERIQQAMQDAGILIDSEFKITLNDPPIFGFGDVILDWAGEELLGEIKTMPNEGFEYRKAKGRPKAGHLIQLFIYMKILKRDKAVLIYENKNNHELLVMPVQVAPGSYAVQWVNQAFDWMKEVRKAWEDKMLPTKNYRSNSKICKTCPIRATCDGAGEGLLKIKSLEPLDEDKALSVV